MDPVGAQCGDGSSGRRAETDHDCAASWSVLSGGSDETQGVEDRAVPGEFVVLVEYVQAEVTLPGPVVHRFEGDEGEALVDRGLCQLGVLHTVGPPPEGATGRDLGHVRCLGLGEQEDIGGLDDLRPLCDPAHTRLHVPGFELEVRSVPAFDDHPRPDVRIDAIEVMRMKGQATLVLHRGSREDAERQEGARPGLRGVWGVLRIGGGEGRLSGAGHPGSHHRGTGTSSDSSVGRYSTAPTGRGPMGAVLRVEQVRRGCPRARR